MSETEEAFIRLCRLVDLHPQIDDDFDVFEASADRITTLRAQLEEARAKAINACIKIADNHAVMADSCIEKGAAEMIAVDLRALLHGSTK